MFLTAKDIKKCFYALRQQNHHFSNMYHLKYQNKKNNNNNQIPVSPENGIKKKIQAPHSYRANNNKVNEILPEVLRSNEDDLPRE